MGFGVVVLGGDAEAFFEGCAEVLGGGIAEFEGDLCGCLLGALELVVGEQEAGFGEVGVDACVEDLFKTSFELKLVDACDACQLWKGGWHVKAVHDVVAGKDDAFAVVIGGDVAGLGALGLEVEFDGPSDECQAYARMVEGGGWALEGW